jgi:hypothetical protein
MGLLSGNSCNIITIFPLGLDCDSLNATTPDDANGLVTLYITGGTPPYNVTWDNGSQGTLITNLLPGSYTATVTDYYKDFTATTTCNVDFDSFYLEEFYDCNNGNQIFYLADLPSIFVTGKTYELTTQVGCWISSGLTLYTGQTYYSQTALIQNGPFDSCLDCLPQPIPEPTYPQNLCMTFTKEPNFISQINFSSGNTINNYPSWTASSPSFLMYYNSGNTRWEISGWTSPGSPYFGTPVFLNPSAPPVGTWTINGVYGYNLLVTSGVCTGPPLVMRLSQNGPSCTTTSDGTINVFASGGIPPYTYSLDNVNYQISSVFTNLPPSTYTVYVKDSNNTITTQSATLTPQETFQNYTINLTPISQNTIFVSQTETRTYTFKIEVTPPLPITKTLSFTLPISVLLTGNTTSSTPIINTQQASTVSFSTLGTANITGPTTTIPVVTTSVKPAPCTKLNVITSAYTQTYQGTITGNSSIIGTLTQQLTTPSVSYEIYRCPLSCNVKNVIGLNNSTLTPSTCSYLNSAVQPIIYEFSKTGEAVQS